MLEHVQSTLDGEESVRVLLLSNPLHKDGKIVMVVELVDFDLPCDPVGRPMLNLDGQVTPVVETTELTWRNLSSLNSTGSRCQNSWLFFSLVQGTDFTTDTLAFLCVC